MNRFILVLLIFVGCNPLASKKDLNSRIGENSSIPQVLFSFTSSSNYTFDSNYISVTAGQAVLLTADQTDSTSSDFSAGTHMRTVFNGTALTYDSSNTDPINFDASWTPQYGNISAYWKLDGTGTVTHGTALTATIGSNGTIGIGSAGGAGADFQVGKIDSSLNFDGVGDYVIIPHPFSISNRNNSYSYSLWVKVDAFPNPNQTSGQYVMGSRTGTWARSGVQVSNAGNILYSYHLADSSNDTVRTVNPISEDTWYHVVVSADKDAATIDLYVNGIFQEQMPYPMGTIHTSNWKLGIGHASYADSLGGQWENWFIGNIDEVAIWNASLSADEVFNIYNKQKAKYSGYYTSRVMNLGTSGSWTNLDWVTSLPFGKELPGSSGNEQISEYSSLVDSTGSNGNSELLTNLNALWHLNETTLDNINPGTFDFEDFGASSRHLNSNNLVASENLGKVGVLGAAVLLNGVDENLGVAYATRVASTVPQNESVSAWFKVRGVNNANDNQGVFAYHNLEQNPQFQMVVWSSGQTVACNNFVEFMGGNVKAESTSAIEIGKWYHVVCTSEYVVGTSTLTTNLYLNGVLQDSDSFSADQYQFNATNVRVGLQKSTFNRYFNGFIDEVAWWSRTLNSAEVLEIYRRGANRVSFQVRSCDDSACSGENWIGPDGTTETYFSELLNCTSIDGGTGLCDGARNTALPSLTFSDYVSAPSANQYFQYRAILESDDEVGVCAGSTTCLPAVSSIEVGPSSRYFAGSPSVTNTNPVSFTSLSAFTETVSGTCTPSYQISNDNVTYYYHNGANWVAAASAADSNNAVNINTNISSFTTDISSGDLYIRSFLNSDSSQDCNIVELRVTYE